MALKTRKKGGINQPLIILAGLIVLLGAVMIYYFILRGVYGRFDTESFRPDAGLLKQAVLGGEPKIAILYSKYTENMLPAGSTWLNDNITTWRKFLDASKLGYELISDETIELGQHYNYDLIVLPGSQSLSDREVIQLKKFIDRGGSIFATSGTASYSNDGKWRGWEFFSEVFGLKFTKELDSDEYTKVHTLRGSLPITANIPTGYPLKVATWDKPIAVEVLDPRTTQVSFWYNYRLEDGLVREQIKRSAGIAYGTYGKGRFVWMGFEINSVIGVQEDYIYFDRLFNNCINWLTYQPLAYVSDWPVGYNAAAVVAPSLTGDMNNIQNLIPVLKSENVSATFFVDPARAETNRELIRSLVPFGEVASLIDIGYLASINDTVNSLNDHTTQVEKLRNAKFTLETITNRKIIGLLPYYGLFDHNTVSAAIDAGYSYVLTDSLTDRSVPKTIIMGDNRILSMTKTARDDYEVIRDFGLNEPQFQFYTYQEDVDRVLFEGGMYIFKMHTEYQCKPENVGVVRDVIQDLKSKNFWITTLEEIHNWYVKRDQVELRTNRRGDRRIELKISNPGSYVINQLVLEIDLNDYADRIELNTEIIGTKAAKYSHSKGSKVLQIYIDDLKAKESRTYYIDYDRIKV